MTAASRNSITRTSLRLAAVAPLRLATAVAALLLVGCAGPGPGTLPTAPQERVPLTGGGYCDRYDLNDDDRIDYEVDVDAAGRATLLRYADEAAASAADAGRSTTVDLPAHRATHDVAPRQLLIILDSVPYDVVRDYYDHGGLRIFGAPGRVVSTYPVMTDPALCTFFDVLPCPGIESQRFNGQRLVGGLGDYLDEVNMPWLRCVQVALNPLDHGPAYLWPRIWLKHELRDIERALFDERPDDPRLIAYCVATSAHGALRGRDGHQISLVLVDRFCEWLMARSRGRLEITLMSDHGHNLLPSKRVLLRDQLKRMDWTIRDRIGTPRDIVVPEFGPVSCAVIYTTLPRDVARDVVGMEGVELVSWLDESQDVIHVLGRDSEATIRRTNDGALQYLAERGDPLRVLATRSNEQTVTRNDAEWFETTWDADYPDAVHRLWRAYHGLLAVTPGVLVSLQDGYFCGSTTFTDWIDLAAVHGNLARPGSTGFAITTAGDLPAATRMEDLAAALNRLGLDARGPCAAPTATSAPTTSEARPATRLEDTP